MSEKDKLEQVWHDNVRDNQIGGVTDGISPEVAADIGYLPPDEARSIGNTAISGVSEVTEKVSDQPDVQNVIDIDEIDEARLNAIEEKLDRGETPTLEEIRYLNKDAQDKRGGQDLTPNPNNVIEMPGRRGRSNWRR
jgi:hypothetical protein